ncbi:MAG: tetratricopeptide repeat protein [Polyangiales bacterium]
MTTERAATSREADNLPIGRAPFIGRMQERAAIAQAVSQSITESRCEVVTVLGNPGVGKSRLVEEALADLRERYPDLRDYRGTARPDTGLQPAIARILRQRFGLRDGADALAQANEVCAQVMDLFGDRRVDEILHFLGAFLGLRAGTTALAEAVDEDPRTFQLVSLAVLRRFFEVDAQRSPVALVFEDIHCAGPDGIRTLRSLLDSLRGAPIVIFCTARPELLTRAHDFCATPRDRHLRVDLAPLSPSESDFLARSLLSPIESCPRELVDAAVRMGGGNPQLTHTLVRIFFDQGIITVEPGGTCLIDLDRLGQVSLPMSIEDAVHARVAALTPAERQLLERAALMGPVFWVGGLVVLGRLGSEAPALWGGGEDLAHHYRDLLNALEQREFVQKLPRSSIPGEEEYVFRNSLEREHLEGSVPDESAREYHQVVAEWLEFRFEREDGGPRREAAREHAARTEEQWDQLARHYERGDRKLRAARCYKASAEIARHRYANQKAVEHYTRALSMFGEHDVALRLEVHEHFGGVLRTMGRTEEAFKQYSAMLALAWRFDLKNKGGAAHNLVGRLYRDAGNLDEAMRHFGTGLALYQAADDQRGIASSYDDIGYTHWRRGAFETAERFLQDGLDRREALGDDRSIALSLNNIGLVYQDTGQYRRAREALTRALLLREQVGDKPGKVATLNNLGELHKDLGEHERAIATWRQALETAREIGDRRRQAVLMLNIGQGKYRLGDTDESIKILTEVEDMCVELGDRLVLAEARRALGKAYFHHGDIARAEAYLERALELFEQVRSRSHTAIAQRSLAQVLRAFGREDEKGRRAEALFRKALAAFEELGAEIQLARTGKELAEFLLESPDGRPPSPATFAEADELRARSEDIFDKLRRDSADAAIPEGLMRTNPGLSRLRGPSNVPLPSPAASERPEPVESIDPVEDDDADRFARTVMAPPKQPAAPAPAPAPTAPQVAPQAGPPSSPSGSAFAAVQGGGGSTKPLVPRASIKPPPVPPKPPAKG